MPEFTPGESKVAIATFPVKPAGLSCSAELWLALNGSKVATSGEIPFVSTGIGQSISLPVTMPSTEGTYPVYLDILVAGQLIYETYRAIEDVVIVAPVPLPFTFGDARASLNSFPPYHRYPGDPWEVNVRPVIFTCLIANATNRTITHTLQLWYQSYRFARDEWTHPYKAGAPCASRVLTLKPGESHRYECSSKYQVDTEWKVVGPCLFPDRLYRLWLEDEIGNKSPVASVSR